MADGGNDDARGGDDAWSFGSSIEQKSQADLRKKAKQDVKNKKMLVFDVERNCKKNATEQLAKVSHPPWSRRSPNRTPCICAGGGAAAFPSRRMV
jgi:hypothetical protein